MTSSEIRQSFLDFFREKKHTIVPSSSLLPDSPNLLFTNAGMNQFVPIFLGQTKCPYVPGRAADTQKCIRAGGKHNDLDDVGLDTYHHTFFEMLGNWSFGDYFKREAIDWAWSLVIGHWSFPPSRLYATIYSPDKSLGDPSEFDREAHDFWAEKFRAAGLDPAVHIVNGNKKDNFWMMGDTGPCGPCSELHVDLTPLGDTRGSLVNKGDARCIEIWNLVFIQFNANPDGTFTPLPAQHVDTGMGFERVTSIIQSTKNFTDFANAKISNYETDIFRPIFDELERMSGKKYASTLPDDQKTPVPEYSGPSASGSGSTAPLRDSAAPSRDPAIPSPHLAAPSGEATAPSRSSDAPLRDSANPSGGGTVPTGGQSAPADQIALDIAFRVIADHIRTLSFAIADGIQPGNTDRNYVLRRILRRAVRYGRTLGFHEPFFYKLVAVLARTMGDVFPEIRAKQKHVEEVLKREEEAFNKTLDRGIELFEREAARLTGAQSASGSAGFQPAPSGILPDGESGARYWKRRLPHYERPHGIYHVTFSTKDRRILSPAARQTVLEALVYFERQRYDLFAACVMPDHVHVLFRPWPKEDDAQGNPVFWSLSELMHSVKSFTATKINKAEGIEGQQLWENEYHDRLMRSDADVEEKFQYVCRNPWTDNVVGPEENYPWLWTWNERAALHEAVRQDAGQGGLEARAPLSHSDAASRVISGAFAFRLYDEQGFPLDLTELMARERGLTVDVASFEKLMDEQRARARAAQKKTVIALSEIETKEPTNFVGYDQLSTPAKVLEVVAHKDKTAVILDTTAAYAEMGGQVGDTGELARGADTWRITNTQKSGATWLHFLEGVDTPDVGAEVTLGVEVLRRRAIERHHTVTHLLHWALHEIVSHEATQKGSFVGPDKLTFDFNSAALTPAQVRDIEKLVNERIVENAGVAWTEVPYAEVRGRADVMQFFGDKYGDTVRVVQIGGAPDAFNGYSMELCAGTHTRATGEIGLFKIVSEAAIAAGVRRIEAVAGLSAYEFAASDAERLKTFAAKLNAPVGEIEKKLDVLLAQQKDLEKALKAAQQRDAAGRAKDLLASAETINGTPAIIANLGSADGDTLQTVADAIKALGFKGVIVLGGAANETVALVAAVTPDFTAKTQAGKIIQTIAPIVGGKGGGKPDNARGGGKDASKLDEALAKARTLLG
jgi:alanyl-tRNA synthetase/REP element-mobilizing transposase RayT